MDQLDRKINIRLNVTKSLIPKAEYVFRTFCKIIGLQPEFFYSYSLEHIDVYYGPKQEESYPVEIYYDPQTAHFFEQQLPLSRSGIHFVRYRGEHIPFLFSQTGTLFSLASKKLTIRKDIIASAFYFLSCWAEYVKDKDANAEQTVTTADEEFNHIPVVDRYCEMFQKALEIQLPGYEKKNKWTEDNDIFAVCVSHLLASLDDYEEGQAQKQLKQVTNLIKCEKKKGYPSSFLLPVLDSRKKPAFSLDKFSAMIEDEKKRKYSPADYSGLHCGLFSEKIHSRQALEYTQELYENKAIKIKGHLLTNLTDHYGKLFNVLEETSVGYDMSIAFYGSSFFRAGISFPYYPFDLADNKPYNVLEIPPTVMILSPLQDPSALEYPSLVLSKSRLSYLLRNLGVHSSLLTVINELKAGDILPCNRSFNKKIFSFAVSNKGFITTPDYICDKWLTR